MSVGLTPLPRKKKFVTDTLRILDTRMDNSVTTRHVKRLKRRKTDITLAIWNVRTLKRPGKLKKLRSELDKYGVKIAALQELT